MLLYNVNQNQIKNVRFRETSVLSSQFWFQFFLLQTIYCASYLQRHNA